MPKAIPMLVAAVMCSALYAGAAQAQAYSFTDYQRAVIGDWVVNSIGGCPSGSRTIRGERENMQDSLRCVFAPGSGIVYYAPSEVIPMDVPLAYLPPEIIAQLPQPKVGEVYVVVDNNVYLITPETRTVVAAVMVMKTED